MPNPNLDYTRRLPHRQPPGAVVFVTFGLAGSLPKSVEQQLKRDAELLKRNLKNLPGDAPELVAAWKKLFKFADDHWDRSEKVLYLKSPAAARAVELAVEKAAAENHYRLHRYCIMPNHVHLLIEPMPENAAAYPPAEQPPEWPPVFYTPEGRQLLAGTAPVKDLVWQPLWNIMKSLKGSTAHAVNRAVGRSGQLWMPESYDHWIRNAGEYARVVDYIDNNPVKAGLCRRPSDWKFSSASAGLASHVTE